MLLLDEYEGMGKLFISRAGDNDFVTSFCDNDFISVIPSDMCTFVLF